jgi:hypothetical protein
MRTFIRAGSIAGLLCLVSITCGCAGNPTISCKGSVVISVNPPSATLNHSAAPPGNQVQFVATAAPTAPPGCPVPQWIAIVYGTWTNPDPTDIQISSTSDSTNGTAVCKATTNGPVTLTGTFSQMVQTPVTKTVQLTCD